jgi:twinkle protein
MVNGAKPYPISGLYGADHFETSVKDLYIKGLGKGLSTGYTCVDDLYSIAPGQLSVVTGVPSSGKSEFVDQLMVNLATNNNWRFAVASFENPPALHIAKLASKRERKPFFTGPTARMNEAEFERSMTWVKEHFYFIHDEHGSTSDLESILERLRSAVKRYGVRGVVIDPYNYISRPSADISETQWISDMLSKVCAFARAHDVHVWFVAHPAKMMRANDGKIPVPKGYDISGSAAWFAKADCGLTVHRPDPYVSNETEIHVWKMRFSWLGRQGMTSLNYVPASYTYEEPVKMARNYGLKDMDFD